ncbi:MAG: hypothetical protein HPY55_08155 [Firmicutes bacterium]|nr:hypothetical protein [Bacillota bacterium]
MAKRILAIILIYAVTSAAWMMLGGLTHERTQSARRSMEGRVAELWGTSHRQTAPEIYYVEDADGAATPAAPTVRPPEKPAPGAEQRRRVELIPEASNIKVGFHLDQRRKGLLWFSTYSVAFDGTYTVKNTTSAPRDITVAFALPTSEAIYDDLQFYAGESPVEGSAASQGRLATTLSLSPGESRDVRVAYRSRGLDNWAYAFGKGATQVKNFLLEMTTDFKAIDFPGRTISPSTKEEIPGGWRLVWDHKNLISGFMVGMEMPKRLNPGPLASQISFFAPVSLLFFFFVIFILCVVRDIRLHPMHYFFLAAAFFSFHLLFAYLVDHTDVNLAFALASLTSVALVVSYLAAVVGQSFAYREAAAAQVIYLVLFSYTHFFTGFTGLSVTIVAILTLAAAMRLTAHIDWDQKFRGGA